MLDPNAPDHYVDHTGCGNTLNSNNPQVQKL
jgi:pullulanase/glycogen debranching enzyme